MRPISARTGVVVRFVMPKQARFILHNKDGARKHFFDTELRHFWSPPDASLKIVSGKSDSNEKKNQAVSIES
jgi:hypothetical protein